MTTTVRAPLPTVYLVWLSGSLLSRLGDTAFFFALGWAATGYGGRTAGLVLTAVALPRTLLLLLGGVVGDRICVRRVLLVGDGTMVLVVGLVAALSATVGPSLWLLITAGLVVGAVDAFTMPSAASMARRLVPLADVDRASGLNQTRSQLISLIAGPVGAFLVATGGLGLAAAVDAGTFGFALVAVLMRKGLAPHPPSGPHVSLLRSATQGVALSIRHPVLRPGLLLTGAVAGLAIPVGSLLVPLLARAHHWGPQGAGLLLGAQAVGALAVSAAVARSGALPRAGVVAAGSAAPMAVGVCLLALASQLTLGVAGAVLLGAGIGLFVTHLGPLLLCASPGTHLARVQAVITLVQNVSLLATVNLVGVAADEIGAPGAALGSAALLALAGTVALMTPGIRAGEVSRPG